MSRPINLSDNLEKLHTIARWFDEQTQIDVEEGLLKVKEAAGLIKESKSRLQEIENEFKEIQSEISLEQPTADELEGDQVFSDNIVNKNEVIEPDDVPF